MFKRLFWLLLGFVAGVIVVTKARAYVKAKMPDSVNHLLFSDESENLTVATMVNLYKEFTASRKAHEAQMNARYEQRHSH